MDLRKLCRICFVDSASVDIREHRSSGSSEQTVLELIHTMFGRNIDLNLTEELPMICSGCLKECQLHYAFYRKLKFANQQLLQLYNDAEVEMCQDVETLKKEQPETNAEEGFETWEEFSPFDFIVLEPQTGAKETERKTDPSPKPSQKLANQDSLIVSEFLPATTAQPRLDLTESRLQQLEEPAYEVRTVDYAAVELKHYNLDEYNETNRLLDVEPSGSQAIYKCQYCPLAYASPQYLKTHVRNSHVCKYCTTAFAKVRDLNEHIRRKHSHHQCVVCSNTFSTSSNLRAHLKKIHGVQLPAQVALLDYKPASASQDNPGT
ncbi:LOW QUALITY PROTEIN: transcription factor E4F1 [Drosophila eugracilis]|uniref:LOW QUALITY PROTEIN: transcription factor E4F1 n=1 Tax=Drosophila eugracilis TaxID=29029 RepID=UPI001BD97A1D|nr:LOW QUALITY PROTEIN: transcription factor E4F1 [Drosophila eugracilis]